MGLRNGPASVLCVGSLPKIRQAQNPDRSQSQGDAQLQDAAAFSRNFVLRRRKASFLLEIDSLGVNPVGYDSDLKSPRSLAKVFLPDANHLTCTVGLGRMKTVLFLLLSAFPIHPLTYHWHGPLTQAKRHLSVL